MGRYGKNKHRRINSERKGCFSNFFSSMETKGISQENKEFVCMFLENSFPIPNAILAEIIAAIIIYIIPNTDPKRTPERIDNTELGKSAKDKTIYTAIKPIGAQGPKLVIKS